MNRLPQVSMWKLYLEIVHNILVFDILRHEFPHGLIGLVEGMIKMVEQNGGALAILLAVGLSVGRTWWSGRTLNSPKEEPKRFKVRRSKE